MHYNVLVKVNSVRSEKKGDCLVFFRSRVHLDAKFIRQCGSDFERKRRPQDAQWLFDTFSSEQYARDIRFFITSGSVRRKGEEMKRRREHVSRQEGVFSAIHSILVSAVRCARSFSTFSRVIRKRALNTSNSACGMQNPLMRFSIPVQFATRGRLFSVFSPFSVRRTKDIRLCSVQ